MLSILLSASVANAKSHAEVKLISSDKAIKDLEVAMKFVEKNSNIPIMFPKKVPQIDNTTLYAVVGSEGGDSNYNKYWSINASNTKNCDTRACIVGGLYAEKDGKLELNYETAADHFQKPIPKEKVELNNHVTSYYTPAHAEADWHVASIEWIKNDVLYQLHWDMKGNSKKVLTEMANLAMTK
jgi:hypothetical protein